MFPGGQGAELSDTTPAEMGSVAGKLKRMYGET